MAGTPLAGRNAVVLGVERPAGRKAAVALAEAGANVAVLTLSKETQAEFAANSTANEFWALGRNGIALTSDSGETTVREAIAEAAVQLGQISIVVAHAPEPLPRAALTGLRSDPAIVVLIDDTAPEAARRLLEWTRDLADTGLRANALVTTRTLADTTGPVLKEHHAPTALGLAAAVIYLVSDASAAVEGAMLVVGSAMDDRAQCVELCRRHSLELLGFRESASGASRWIAHVRDKTGASLLLKQTIPQRGASEAAALRAWNVTGSAARLIEELGEGAYLAEWLDSVSLAGLPPTEFVDFASVGRVLRSLHAIPPPQTLDDIRSRFTTSVMARWHDLPPEMIALADEAAIRLRSHDPRNPVMLHGDLVPSNVMMTGGGPRVIDPFPCEGLAAWDIAQLAAAAAGRGRRGVIAPLLEGYASAPSLLAEMYSWMLLSFLQSNLAAQRLEFSDNLRPLALELVRIGDPNEFLRRQCAVG